jgi:transcriptional regulator with XRE-family HTH domain
MPLAERLSWSREQARLSKAELEALAGLPPTSVHYIERGRSPSAEALQRIAAVLGASTNWLLSGEGQAPTPEAIVLAVLAARKR